jgi:hypothetical protein
VRRGATRSGSIYTSKNVRDASGTSVLTPFVVSVSTMFV